jgi:hypothetical protein
MSDPKLTDWFDKSVTPARVGIYQIRLHDDSPNIRYAMWRGDEWSWFADTINDVMNWHVGRLEKMHPHGYFPWRGLAKEPA